MVLIALSATRVQGEVSMEKAINLTIDKISSSQIEVSLHNASTDTLKVWKDSNSWGAACWRVVVLRGDSLKVIYRSPDQQFTRNIPTSNEIGAGKYLGVTLNLKDGLWNGLGEGGFDLQPGDTIIVLYDVPATKEAYKFKVWYGVVAAYGKMQ